ncbi:MAG TPA: hypothetical protein VNM87_13315 [Candidatus Udaeobacter sp.]|nr:hypothetical protein [Candidatus Udaeobacter sp.]
MIIGIAISCTLGLLGGAVGTYCSIKNTSGPQERAFMIRAALVTWVLVTAFVAGLILLPHPYGFLLWIPYSVALPLGIRWGNRRQMEIRTAESGSR